MTIVRRIAEDYRGALLVLGLLAVLAFGGLFLGVYPLRARVARSEAEATAAAHALRAARQQEIAARRLVTGQAQAARDLERFYTEILPASQTAARRLTHLQVSELAEGAGLVVERRAIDVERRRESPLVQMTARMSLRGSYEDVRRFLRDLETSREFVVISGISLAQPSAGTELSLQLDLETYYRVGDGG